VQVHTKCGYYIETMMSSIMKHTNDINKYCACANKLKALQTEEAKKTMPKSVVDASMTKRMKYSVYVQTNKYQRVVDENVIQRIRPPQFPTSSF
jgi:hypothetical protein